MHELSIAEALLSTLALESRRRGAAIEAVGLRVGEYSGVEPESLRFCFDAVAAAVLGAAPRLEIEHPERSTDLQIAWIDLAEDTP